MQPMTNSEVTERDIIATCGDKGHLWAAQFCKRNPAIDEGTMIAWFANAIEAAINVRAPRRVPTWGERIGRIFRDGV